MSFCYRSLLVRNALALVALVLVSQAFALTAYLFFVQRPRIDAAALLTASQIATVTRLLAALSETEREQQLLAINGVEQNAVPMVVNESTFPANAVARRFIAQLSYELGSKDQILIGRDEGRRIWVRLNVADSHYWMLLAGAPNTIPSLSWTLICLILSVATFPALFAFLIHRPVERFLLRLAHLAGLIERGNWPETMYIKGPRELEMVAGAFNRMASTLQELETTRAEMLAGISHDIRTPLTKLRMVVSAPESVEYPLESAERFIDEIDLIVQQFIDFARGWGSEAATTGDLNGLIERLAQDYAGLGYSFDLSLDALPRFPFRPTGMQRLLTNLLTNAAVYGRVGLAVKTRVANGFVIVEVDDKGSGVPEALLPLLKQPFRRGPQSEQRGGTGLGLAIADRIAGQHGGTLKPMPNTPHGLRAKVSLPIV